MASIFAASLVGLISLRPLASFSRPTDAVQVQHTKPFLACCDPER
jgi:hypothetical protein